MAQTQGLLCPHGLHRQADVRRLSRRVWQLRGRAWREYLGVHVEGHRGVPPSSVCETWQPPVILMVPTGVSAHLRRHA